MELIAEIAQAHDGSLGVLHSYIDALADTGVGTIKFQTHIAEAESSEFEAFRVNFSYVDKTRFDYWKRMGFTPEQWQGIKKHCDEKGLEMLSSPFSIAAVNLLEDLGVKRYKVGSGEITNLLMLDRLAKTGKEIILSSGMSNWAELDRAINFLQDRNCVVSLLQCTTAYPTPPEAWGLQGIAQMKARYPKLRVGYSDHSGTPVAGLAAAALGAEILEFHAVFDHRMFGPDSKASLTINQIKELANGVKAIEAGLARNDLKEDSSAFDTLKVMFGKSLAVNKALPAGHILSINDLESKKPGDRGILASDFEKIIGQKLAKALNEWDFINWNDLQTNPLQQPLA